MCADLKVLGKRDFKELLRWRAKIVDARKAAERKRKEEEEQGNVVVVEAKEQDLDAEVRSIVYFFFRQAFLLV